MAKELQELGKWKVGMLVIDYGTGLRPETVYKVTRITDGRGGTIYIGDTAYDMDGRQRGGDTWHYSSIAVASPEDLQRVRTAAIKAHLRRYDWGNLTDVEAVQVDEYLKSIGINIREKTK